MGPRWPGHYFCQFEKRLPQPKIKCTRPIHQEFRFNLACCFIRSSFFFFSFFFFFYRQPLFEQTLTHPMTLFYCVRGTTTHPQFLLGILCIIGRPVQLISEIFWDCTLWRLPLCRHTFASLSGACLRFASLWRTNLHGDSCVLGVHLSNVCWGLLFCLRKAFIFEKFAESS